MKKTALEFLPTVKWGQGCWALGGVPKVYIHAEPDHVQFGFYAGSKLKDLAYLLIGNGKQVRYVKVFTTKSVSPAALIAFLKQVF